MLPLHNAITDMVVRGAPAIGAAAAFGLALAGYESASSSRRELIADLQAAAATLKAARPDGSESCVGAGPHPR